MLITLTFGINGNACIIAHSLFQTAHNLKLLEEALMPASALDLGGSLQTILDLRQKWNEMKPHFQVNRKKKRMCLDE